MISAFHYGPGDASCHPFLAVIPDDPLQILSGERVDEIISADFPTTVHPHIQGGVHGKAESPLCRIQLMGGDPQIEEDAIHLSYVPFSQNRFHVGEIPFHENLSFSEQD